MSNLAKLTARVAFHGPYWTVSIGDQTCVVRTKTELIAVLTGDPMPNIYEHHTETVVTRGVVETVEQFLARGGQITKLKAIYSPLPVNGAPVASPSRPAASAISLEWLGLVPPKPKAPPEPPPPKEDNNESQ